MGPPTVLRGFIPSIVTARSRRLPAAATPLVSECGKCNENIGISVSLPVYVPQ